MVTTPQPSHWIVLLLPLLVFGVPTEEPTASGEVMSPTPSGGCQHCCDSPGPPDPPAGPPGPANPSTPTYILPEVRPYINITILKGDKGDRGSLGTPGKLGKEGPQGERGPQGLKGSKGQVGIPGKPCQARFAAFSVGRKKALHSSEGYQSLVFDTVFVNLDGRFDMFSGRFFCPFAGLYFFSLNVHTWNFKETYMHIMRNEEPAVILYAQPSDRSIMQGQSVMMELQDGDQAWVRLFKRERENAIYSDDVDTYITFSGHLIKPADE
ncbi:complement C1q tumor necrosis factor-related protein 6 [Tachyglossus aculeatus]|uniref:complement C1q tumor necrosis factor-related protein 6 n=1 Tax=Tachyglossus aculeatus TaxID=9261 RepID=UPI0018F6ECDE|nr:complement C1q tumor necrosis factor-related protein 6 [Tachyglossus aculeatus]